MSVLTIGLSTVRQNLGRGLQIARSIIDLDCDQVVKEIVIVSQRSSCSTDGFVSERIRLIEVAEQGLSKSRNRVIAEATGSYIWFIDDDVQIDGGCIAAVKRLLPVEGVLLGRIGCVGSNGFYKDYDRRATLPFGLLRVSSIELIVNANVLKTTGVRFDERLGLGGDYPCSEENAFVIDLYAKGVPFSFAEEVIIRHPCGEAARTDYFAQPRQMVARGIVARKLGLLRGGCVCLYWATRVFGRPRPLALLSAMFGGLLRG